MQTRRGLIVRGMVAAPYSEAWNWFEELKRLVPIP